jgi:ATP-dependent RNA helicase DDX54/DBP10
MVKSQQINPKFTKNRNLNPKKKFANDETQEKQERKFSNYSKSEDELDDSDNTLKNKKNKPEKKLNNSSNQINNEIKNDYNSDKEEAAEVDLFNEENAKKYENENLILETPLHSLRYAKGKNDKKAKGFRSFSLSPEILMGVKRMGYKMPTPIQRKCVPNIMSGFNVIAHSRTGSGKTAAFILPILHRLKEHSKLVGCRCLIVCPTRELAHQTMTFCKKLGKVTNLKYALLVGGNELEGQFERLAQNPDIIIATPGRVMHHLVIN